MHVYLQCTPRHFTIMQMHTPVTPANHLCEELLSGNCNKSLDGSRSYSHAPILSQPHISHRTYCDVCLYLYLLLYHTVCAYLSLWYSASFCLYTEGAFEKQIICWECSKSALHWAECHATLGSQNLPDMSTLACWLSPIIQPCVCACLRVICR